MAATNGGAVCDGPLETLTAVVLLLEDRAGTLCNVIINMSSFMIMYDVISAKNILSFKIVYKKYHLQIFSL